MKYLHGALRCSVCALAISLLFACNDYVPHDADPPAATPDEIQGIATPSSVSVVTATNAD